VSLERLYYLELLEVLEPNFGLLGNLENLLLLEVLHVL
jgi:hypothetical protein